MKYLTLFLVLSLVVFMAEPADCFFKRLWRAGKAIFRGARTGWRAHRDMVREERRHAWENSQRNQDQPPEKQYVIVDK